MRGTLEERFWTKVDRKSDTQCWLWTAYIAPNGYGIIGLKLKGRHTIAVAHRISWELHYGPIPGDLKVLHHCDTPACVNPKHLFLGTQADNVEDMMKKSRNRVPIGQDHANSKLTEADVRRMLRRRQTGASITELMKEFRIGRAQVHKILSRQAWKHVTVGQP